MFDLNHGSGPLFKPPGWVERDTSVTDQILAHIDAALEGQRANEKPREYIGASELGEECLRKLYFASTGAPRPAFTGGKLRIFQMGHRFESMMADWIKAAGFQLLERSPRSGKQFEFITGKGRIKGHCDGIIIEGPKLAGAPPFPWLWENKALKAKFWTSLVKQRLQAFDVKYWAQSQLYMGYFELPWGLFTSVNKDTAEIYFEFVPYQVKEAQRFSDRGVDLIRAIDTGQLPPRMPGAKSPDFFKCRWCDFSNHCWGNQ